MRSAQVAAAGLIGLLGAPAAAQTPRWNPAAPENRQLLPNFSYATVEPVLDALGTRHQRAGTPAAPAISVTFANGRRAALVFGNCEQGGAACKALSIQSVWAKPANAAPDRVAAAVQQFNRRYAFSRALVTSDGRPVLQRYLTADYGFIRGNLAVNLLVFASQAERFNREVLQPLQPPRR